MPGSVRISRLGRLGFDFPPQLADEYMQVLDIVFISWNSDLREQPLVG
jgi:hypothetical protein